jgi:hypothetical protein
MRRRICVAAAVMLLCGMIGVSRAADVQDANAIVDKAIKAVGGAEALGKIKAASWKAKTTMTFGGQDAEGKSEVIWGDLTHYRQVFEFERDGNTAKITSILAGEKGVRAFGDMQQDMEKEAVANMKRTIYLTVIPVTLVALKDKDFKVEGADEVTVEGKPAVGIKVTAPDKKDFKLYFDKESGLPVRLVATVANFRQGQPESTQETTYSDYKEMGGIKKATKIVVKRDGMKFQEQKITEFKALEKVEAKTFTDL